MRRLPSLFRFILIGFLFGIAANVILFTVIWLWTRGQFAALRRTQPYLVNSAGVGRAPEPTLEPEAGLSPTLPGVPALLVLSANELEDGRTLNFPIPTGADLTLTSELPGIEIESYESLGRITIPETEFKNPFFTFQLRTERGGVISKTHVGIVVPSDEAPIEIRTVAEFDAIRTRLSGRYRLMNDLDFSSVDAWEPIGTPEFPFNGVFEGNGHSILNLHLEASDITGGFSLFGDTNRAIIRDLKIIEPLIHGTCRDVSSAISNTVLSVAASSASYSLIERVGVFGGSVRGVNCGASGIAAAIHHGVFRDLFNSADVYTDPKANQMYNTAGIVGIGSGTVLRTANEGTISGRHLTGGITGLANATITRSINSGRIIGQALVGEFPPGAIFQTSDLGTIYDCLYTVGSAPHPGKIFGGGEVGEIPAIPRKALTDPDALSVLGTFTGESPEWIFDANYAKGPIPAAIFTTHEGDAQ